MTIAFWFLQNLCSKGEITLEEFAMIESAYDTDVVKETEKALYVRFYSELGTKEIWIPKKCILEKPYKRVRVITPEWLASVKQLPKEELKGQIIKETEKAIYFRYRVDLAEWLPKSKIEIIEIE